MWAIIGIAVGIVIGMYLPVELPYSYSRYISCAFLAALDSVLGAAKAGIENKFEFKIFLSGFIANTLLAGFLTFIGDQLGVELYFAAVLTFGMRIFDNFTSIRHDLLSTLRNKTTQQDMN